MSNVEYRRKAFYRFVLIKKTEHGDSILRNSAVRYSKFCGSLLDPAAKPASVIIKKLCHFGVVSYKRRRWPKEPGFEYGIKTGRLCKSS